MCINFLSVAINSKAKKPLCINLSRRYNGVSKTKKLRIGVYGAGGGWQQELLLLSDVAVWVE